MVTDKCNANEPETKSEKRDDRLLCAVYVSNKSKRLRCLKYAKRFSNYDDYQLKNMMLEVYRHTVSVTSSQAIVYYERMHACVCVCGCNGICNDKTNQRE